MLTLAIKYIIPGGQYEISEYNHLESVEDATRIINSFFPEQIVSIHMDYIEE